MLTRGKKDMNSIHHKCLKLLNCDDERRLLRFMSKETNADTGCRADMRIKTSRPRIIITGKEWSVYSISTC